MISYNFASLFNLTIKFQCFCSSKSNLITNSYKLFMIFSFHQFLSIVNRVCDQGIKKQ